MKLQLIDRKTHTESLTHTPQGKETWKMLTP